MTPSKKEKLDYQSIFNLSPTAVILLNSNGIILEANKTSRDWLDLKVADIIGKNIFMVKNLPKESKAKILEQFSYRSEGKDVPPYEIPFQTKTGEKKIGAVYESPIMNKNGDLDKVLVLLCDITQFKNKTTDASIYRTLFENAAASIIFANEKKCITTWNKFTENLFNKSHDDLYQKPLRSLYPKNEWTKICAMGQEEDGMLQGVETKLLLKDGSIIDAYLSMSELKNSSGDKIGSIGIMQNLPKKTPDKKHPQDIPDKNIDFFSIATEKAAAPIKAIRGSMEIVLDESAGELNEEQKDFLNTGIHHIEKLQKFIKDLKDYQMISKRNYALAFVPMDINNFIEEIKTKMLPEATEKGINLDFKLLPQNTKAFIDAEKIKKVFQTLLANALKYTQAGDIIISAVKKETFLEISIKDSGVGIKEENLDEFFNAFFQVNSAKKNETGYAGLGLAISKVIIEKHGGKIWVKSTPNAGSTFSFTLPTT